MLNAPETNDRGMGKGWRLDKGHVVLRLAARLSERCADGRGLVVAPCGATTRREPGPGREGDARQIHFGDIGGGNQRREIKPH